MAAFDENNLNNEETTGGFEPGDSFDDSFLPEKKNPQPVENEPEGELSAWEEPSAASSTAFTGVDAGAESPNSVTLELDEQLKKKIMDDLLESKTRREKKKDESPIIIPPEFDESANKEKLKDFRPVEEITETKNIDFSIIDADHPSSYITKNVEEAEPGEQIPVNSEPAVQAQEEKRSKKKMSIWKIIGISSMAALVLVGLCMGIYVVFFNNSLFKAPGLEMRPKKDSAIAKKAASPAVDSSKLKKSAVPVVDTAKKAALQEVKPVQPVVKPEVTKKEQPKPEPKQLASTEKPKIIKEKPIEIKKPVDVKKPVETKKPDSGLARTVKPKEEKKPAPVVAKTEKPKAEKKPVPVVAKTERPKEVKKPEPAAKEVKPKVEKKVLAAKDKDTVSKVKKEQPKVAVKDKNEQKKSDQQVQKPEKQAPAPKKEDKKQLASKVTPTPAPAKTVTSPAPAKKESDTKQTKTTLQNKEIYTVQVYASLSREDAEEWLKKLQKKNINNAFISTQKVRDGVWYRVRFGSFGTKEEAKNAALRLGFAQTWIDRIR